MRIWRVPFSELDDQRVLGQHYEIHCLWGWIHRDGKKWNDVAPGMGKWSDLENRYRLWDVHRRIAEEMRLRGMNHESPITPGYVIWYNWDEPARPYPQEVIDEDRWHLYLRWDGNFRGRVNTDPAAWEKVAFRYAAQDNRCLHDGEREKTKRMGETAWICLLCKHTVKEWNE